MPSRAYIACRPGAADSTFVPHALCNAFVRTVEVIQCIFLPNGLDTYSVYWSAILTMARVGHSQLQCFSFELSRQYSVYFLPNGLGIYSVCWLAILTMARLGHRSLGSLDVHSYCVGFVFYNEHCQ